jgi:hypothetical protein
MPNIGAALDYFSRNLDSIISYYTGITSGDSAKFDWSQAQFALDRMSLISAMQTVIKTLAGGSDVPASYQSTVDAINAKLAKVNTLYAKVLTLNPDVGQAATLQALYQARYLEAQRTGAPLPQKVQFTPAFTPNAPPVVTVEPGTAAAIANSSGAPAPGKLSPATIGLIAVAAVVAYFTLK